jgi:hypothetical protein
VRTLVLAATPAPIIERSCEVIDREQPRVLKDAEPA